MKGKKGWELRLDPHTRTPSHFLPFFPPTSFNSNIYHLIPPPQNLDLLLKLIQEVPDKHSDTEVLETAAKTLELLCKDEFAIYSRCDVARSSLLDMIVNKYKEANDEYINLLDGVSTGWVRE